jgi:hypothetical protein
MPYFKEKGKAGTMGHMEHIGAHIRTTPRKKERVTERGELMEYFRARLNVERVRDGLAPLSMPRMGKVLQAIPTKDLYYLKSVCDQAKHFSKKFWWEINPKKHENKREDQPRKKSYE